MPIRLDLTVGKLVVTGTIVYRDPLPLPNRFDERDYERDIGSCFLPGRKEEQMRRHGFQTVPRMQWKDAGDFGECSFNGHRWLSDLEPRGSQQAKHDRRGFLFCKQQWGQFKARTEPIPAMSANVCFDRNADILEMRDVAAHRSYIHLQASR